MHEYRLSVDHRKDIWIDDDSPENLADVATFIRDFLAQNQTTMEVNIAAWGLEEADFVEVVTEKSQGNFMYLVHVLRDIRNGQLAPATLDSIYHLPIGLKEYYQRHWRTMREQDPVRFRDYYEPIVCILATAREAVPIRQLVEWTKARWPHLDASIIRDVIRTWREFLNEEQPASGPPIYRVYHASFQNFLEEEIDLSLYHLEIAETALRKIHGLDAID